VSRRHRWVPEVTGYRWRALERCVLCGAMKWLVQFPNRAGKMRQTPLYNATGHFDPWSGAAPECADRPSPAKPGGSP
jgi:hypothetical protein